MRTELGFGARGTFVAERQREQAGRPTAAETEKEKTVTGRFQMSLRTKKKRKKQKSPERREEENVTPFLSVINNINSHNN